MHLPNNLPHPHTAPFSMKVGETGEAFFVLETDEEVPAELLTSPVVMPSEVSDISVTHIRANPCNSQPGYLLHLPLRKRIFP